MPEPPPVGLWTRYVLENPYPLGALLLLAGIVIGWLGLREGRSDRVKLAVIPVLAGLAVIVVGWQIVTSGERAKAVTRTLVDAVVGNDLVAAVGTFADDARFHFGSARNVGRDLDFIRTQLDRLARRYRIEENTITMLDGFTESSARATVHLACWTDAGGYGLTPSQWVLGVEKQADGSWGIADLTLVSVAGKAPSSSW